MPQLLNQFALLIPFSLLFVADAVTGDGVGAPWSSLINLGAVGAVLLWFMVRAEPRLKALERATDRQTRAMILLTLNLPSSSDQIKSLGHDILNEMEHDQDRE